MADVYAAGLKLMELSEAAFLTTLTPEGLPETRAMLNLRNPHQYPGLKNLFREHQNDFRIYFTTNTSSGKFRHVSQNSNVCVYYCQPATWQGLLLSGNIEVVTDPTLKQALWQPGWNLYYPQGPTDPDYTILCLNPKSGKYYGGQLRVQNLTWKH